MPYPVLVDFSLFPVIQRMPKAQRRRFEAHVGQIQAYPRNHTDFIKFDEEGRRLHASAFDDMTIYFWLDDADRHIKILHIVKSESRK